MIYFDGQKHRGVARNNQTPKTEPPAKIVNGF